jgi:hypothetical protein
VQRISSTIAIAFLAGVVLAGGTAFVVTELRDKPAAAPAAQPVTAPQQTAQSSAAPPPAVAQPETAPAQEATPGGVKPEEPSAEVRRKPRPSVAKYQTAPRRQESDEASAAPQPTQQAEIVQNTPPSAPVAASQPAPAPAPAQSPQTLNPPPGTQTAPPPPREPRTATLAAGTPLTVRVNENISTNTNYSGDTFTASLDKPLVVDGFVIADRGSRVLGKVTRAEKAGRVKGVAELSLVLTQIHTTDGQTVNIETAPWTQEGPTSKKSDTAKVAGGAALGAIIGAIAGGGKGAAIGAGAGGAAGTGAVLATRGKPAVVPPETRVTFALSNSVSITERLN